ncbi:hypothetical protein SASPL_133318 [Salvia splendens]|uniref:Peptidase S8 n=1 Tax=Salvia splendens TaxID=180675 RepID=A0A8X8X3Y5_SALSN|nr:hypothetical protein SASPL_133318 [Salvia splendens]
MGFAAKLSAEDLEALRGIKGFISAPAERVYELHTTHSPNFLGLNQNVGFWNRSNCGKGIIIGLLDTGITPGHPSFHDKGSRPRPRNGRAMTRRLTSKPTARTPLARPEGIWCLALPFSATPYGTAAGIAPLAHVAMYRVCSLAGCAEGDIIAGIEAAIEDGVDVLSLSLGGGPSFSTATASLSARVHGHGEGDLRGLLGREQRPGPAHPVERGRWILTVGAAAMDRKLTATVVLGNGEELTGESAHGFAPAMEHKIVYEEPAFCEEDQLTNLNVKGKIAVCELGNITGTGKGAAVKKAGGVGMILINSIAQGNTSSAEAHPPVVTYFSSRGPDISSPGILKPDITRPGNNFLAAWYTAIDNATSNFNMISGTSMSCPHLSGVVALLKNAHPDWSPAAIKSAIMTTADQVNHEGKPINDQRLLPADVFATGAGHVNPTNANDPDLIYDLKPEDYIPYLCGLNLSNAQVGTVVHRRVDCKKETSIREAQLNYSSFSIRLRLTLQNYARTVTNVCEANSEYKVSVAAPAGVYGVAALLCPNLGFYHYYIAQLFFSAQTRVFTLLYSALLFACCSTPALLLCAVLSTCALTCFLSTCALVSSYYSTPPPTVVLLLQLLLWYNCHYYAASTTSALQLLLCYNCHCPASATSATVATTALQLLLCYS